MSTPILFKAYRTTTALLEPAVLGLLLWRQRKGREERSRLGERQGYPSRQRPKGHLIWVHGASIGETLSLLPVVERLTQRGLAVLVTSGTRTSASLISRRLPPGAVHQFVPLDVPRYVRRFLDHWQPDLALIAESEIWPNTIMALDERHIPLVMVNGRMSDRSFQRWQKLPGVIRSLLERFALCLAQTQDDAARLARLGAPRVVVTGNLKFDAAPPPSDPRVVAHLSGLIAGRPVWLAASTHAGEEGVIVAVHRALAKRHPNLLTIIAPRHPHRGPEVAAIVAQAGLRASRRSEGIHPDRATDVYVADTVGEMGLFYRLSPIVVMGGSLVAHGGQNPIEPAKLGAAILHGPHVHNFEDVYAAIDLARGALMVKDSTALARAVSELLTNTALTRDMSRAAGEAVQSLGGAVERTMQSIEPFIVQAKIGARR
ncbi:3-deoxy-D-manno-octulosonic acid transferase [Microvirga guangxiensis]|uniref:3-deoxy-D-manno-octulosonic acid transferase n=1 Tax=Microvirga guangxiensis TaxID=549386 RepID=A0A1G5JHZ1_9HYPH|nr:3-deoxy-D-manno-octulosonic acid transferase [Microvirga guangxiensis]SCY87965.1 3-deoxy-D-manno-octulosonic-acid transferase [Microvirga guangxiensis]